MLLNSNLSKFSLMLTLFCELKKSLPIKVVQMIFKFFWDVDLKIQRIRCLSKFYDSVISKQNVFHKYCSSGNYCFYHLHLHGRTWVIQTACSLQSSWPFGASRPDSEIHSSSPAHSTGLRMNTGLPAMGLWLGVLALLFLFTEYIYLSVRLGPKIKYLDCALVSHCSEFLNIW